jgi:hypothetical protein
MKTLKATVVVAAALLAIGASTGAFARSGGFHGGGFHHGGFHHSSVRFGVFVGAPAFAFGYYGAPYYYPPYPYYYPSEVGVPASAPVYVEQGQPGPTASAPPAQNQSYWYFCRESNGYYPYVNQCAGPWQRVSPQPPS